MAEHQSLFFATQSTKINSCLHAPVEMYIYNQIGCSLSQSTRVKTPQSRFTSQVGEIQQIFIETCQVKIVLPPVNSAHRVSISAESSRKKREKRFTRFPFRVLCFHICYQPYQSRHEPWQRRGSSVHLGTKWVPKWAAAGAIWQRCCKMPRDAQFRRSQRCVATSNGQ